MNDLLVDERLLSHCLGVHLFNLGVVHLSRLLHVKNPDGSGSSVCYGDT